MRSLFVTLAFYAISLPIIPSTTKADLVGVLPTTPGGNDYQAYYDTVADLTWLKSATASGAMTWSNANAWVGSLNINGVTGWRLPYTLQPDASCSDQVIGVQSYGYNCTGSELGNLYYNVFGGVAGTSITTTHNNNYDLFTFVGSFPLYWSATEYTSSPTSAWSFDFNNGWQITASKTATKLAWAVYSGNAGATSVPLPTGLWLFGSGLAGLIGISRQQKASLGR